MHVVFMAILLESDEKVFVAFGLKECLSVGWIEIRDMDCDFVVLDFVGSVSCSIYNRTHHKPANDGPTTKKIDMLDHAFKFLSQIEAFFFLICSRMTGAIILVILEEYFGGVERTESYDRGGVECIGCVGIRVLSTINCWRNRKLNVKFENGGSMVGGMLAGATRFSFLPVALNSETCLFGANVDAVQ